VLVDWTSTTSLRPSAAISTCLVTCSSTTEVLDPCAEVATTSTGNCSEGKSSRGSAPADQSPATTLNRVARAMSARLRTLKSVKRDIGFQGRCHS